MLRLKLKVTIYRLYAKETTVKKNKQTQKAEAMNRSDLAQLVREAATVYRLGNVLGPEYGDVRAQIKKVAIYIPFHAQLGDDDLETLKFAVDESAFEGMSDGEIHTFIVEQFPEHEWGEISCWVGDGLFHVHMNEAKYHAEFTKTVKIDKLADLARESAVFTVFGDIDVPNDDKLFILEVTLNKSEVLELMNEREFIDLVVRQFPEYSGCVEESCDCDEKTGLIKVSLRSLAINNSFADDLIAKGISTVRTSSMRAMHIDLVGHQRLAALVKKSSSPRLSENGPYIRVGLHKVVLELFGVEELVDFILEQFPKHKAGPSGPHIIGKMFALDLVPIAPADSVS